MCDRNVKSEYILKLCALVFEYICERTTKFHEKYYLTAELLIFKYRWQNISVSNTALLTAVTCLEVTCKIPVSYYVSGHRGHRRCLCDQAYLRRPDPLSYKWIGRQFKWGLARRNWPSFCGAGVGLYWVTLLRQELKATHRVGLYDEHALVAWMSVFVKTRCRR